MAEFREKNVVEKDTQRKALMDALNKIRERGQSQFTNPLTVECYEAEPRMWIVGDHSFFYIAEVHTKYWLGIIPRRRYCNLLFTINLDFYDRVCGKKEINCTVFDRSLLEIVKEEIQKYADAFQATAINLTKDFAR